MSVLSHLFGNDVKTMCHIVFIVTAYIHVLLRLHGLSLL